MFFLLLPTNNFNMHSPVGRKGAGFDGFVARRFIKTKSALWKSRGRDKAWYHLGLSRNYFLDLAEQPSLPFGYNVPSRREFATRDSR